MRKILTRSFGFLTTFLVASFSVAQTIPSNAYTRIITLPDPNGHTQIIDLIDNAKNSIFYEVYHLTTVAVQNALVKASKNGITVKVIVDNTFSTTSEGRALFSLFKSNNISIMASSKAFSITHSKSAVIDSSIVLIGSENLTDAYATTREESVVITDTNLASDMLTLFNQDWQNAQNNTGVTPTLQSNELVISPTNSQTKLVALIQSATKTIDVEVENLDERTIINALSTAQNQNHVTVRVIAPYCDEGDNVYFNVPAIQQLASAGVQAKLMPPPADATTPYIHAKFIMVDVNTSNAQGFVGSENFSLNSLTEAREVGIIFNYGDFVNTIDQTFESDWNRAINVQSPNPSCPSN